MSNIELVFFTEDAEAYVVVGESTEEEAREAIHKYEREECGLTAEDELFEGDLQQVDLYETEKNGETFFYWGTECKECNRPYSPTKSGWLGRI